MEGVYYYVGGTMTDETGGKPTLATLLSSGYGGTLAKLMEADADHVTIPTADLTELIAAAEECAGDLMSYVNAEISTRDRGQYPHLRLRYDRNIAPVDRLRAAVARVRGE